MLSVVQSYCCEFFLQHSTDEYTHIYTSTHSPLWIYTCACRYEYTDTHITLMNIGIHILSLWVHPKDWLDRFLRVTKLIDVSLCWQTHCLSPQEYQINIKKLSTSTEFKTRIMLLEIDDAYIFSKFILEINKNISSVVGNMLVDNDAHTVTSLISMIYRPILWKVYS